MSAPKPTAAPAAPHPYTDMTQNAHKNRRKATRRSTEGCSPLTEGLSMNEDSPQWFLWLFLGLFFVSVVHRMFMHHSMQSTRDRMIKQLEEINLHLAGRHVP